MGENSQISIIICTSGRPDALQNCLESLTKQKSQAHFEVIVVKDGSDEKTEKTINGFSQKLNLKAVVAPQKGLALARDMGWRKAEAEIVSWIDDDVIVDNNWLESVLKTFDENPDIGGVSGPTLIPENLLGNRDIFFFYKNKEKLSFLGKIWAWLFLDNKPFEVGRLFKSGAWSPGSNFPRCLKINGLKEVDYLEACNMSLRKELVKRVNGLDLAFQGTAEWCEIDLAQKVKKLGYRLVFNPEVIVHHHISQAGVFTKRANAKERMENLFRFYFRHIFKPRPDYVFKFSCYILFLNTYWLIKTFQTGNINWLSGWLGTLTGLSPMNLWGKAKNLKPLESRYKANKTAKFQAAQTELFLEIINEKYNHVLEIGCGKGYFTYVGAKHGKFVNCYGADIFPDFQKEEIEEYAESVTYKNIKENIFPFEDNSFDLVFSIDVIEHAKDTIKFISENLRVCKKGGEIIIGTPNLLRLGNLILSMAGKLKFPRKIGREVYGDAIHFKEYKADDLIKEIVYSSNNEIRPENIIIYRCWLGILPLNLGFKKFPKFLDNSCQFFFVKFKKPL